MQNTATTSSAISTHITANLWCAISLSSCPQAALLDLEMYGNFRTWQVNSAGLLLF